MSIDASNPVPPSYPRRAGADNIPEHVPQDLIRSMGIPYSLEFLRNPHEYMASLHETQPPIYYDVSPMGNAWQIIKHSDALFMLRHPEFFGNEGATPFPRDPDDYFYFIPIEIDPPDHRKYRKILEEPFSPKGVLKLEDKIRALANDLIDDFIDKGECEFTTAFGRPLPVCVFLDLMGLPQEKRDTFVSWAMALLHSNDQAIMAQSLGSISEYLKEAIEEKRQNPDGKVISQIVHAQFEDGPISEKEIFGFVCFLFIGGLDTVFATLNLIWLWLAEHPEARQEIINDPDNIDAQVEELIRKYGVTFSGRILNKDYEFNGIQMKKGDRITALLPACNYDPDVFPNPTEVNFHRPRKPILSFTLGVHSCMGAHLARLEVKIALQEWFRRIPEFSKKPGAVIDYRPGGVVGPEEVPLVW